jgi:hypothetical protein
VVFCLYGAAINYLYLNIRSTHDAAEYPSLRVPARFAINGPIISGIRIWWDEKSGWVIVRIENRDIENKILHDTVINTVVGNKMNIGGN